MKCLTGRGRRTEAAATARTGTLSCAIVVVCLVTGSFVADIATTAAVRAFLMDTTCQVCRSCQGWRASARILDSEDKEEEHILEVRDVWALAKCTSTEPMLHDIGDDDVHMIMDSVPPQHVINPCGLATIGRARAATSSGALAQRCW